MAHKREKTLQIIRTRFTKRLFSSNGVAGNLRQACSKTTKMIEQASAHKINKMKKFRCISEGKKTGHACTQYSINAYYVYIGDGYLLITVIVIGSRKSQPQQSKIFQTLQQSAQSHNQPKCLVDDLAEILVIHPDHETSWNDMKTNAPLPHVLL